MTITGDDIEKKIRFEFSDMRLTAESIEKIISPKQSGDNGFILAVTRDILKEAAEIADVRAQYRIFSNIGIDDTDKLISIGKVNFNVGKIIYPQLKKSGVFILFLCTAGHLIGERSSAAIKEKDLLAGYILDIAGSEMVEKAADLMQDYIDKQMSASGLKITNRYSPGYCGWDVYEQHKLFSFYENNFCGIKLTTSALMQPVKSVSGIIGAGTNVRRSSYKCRLCDMKNCIYRRREDGLV